METAAAAGDRSKGRRDEMNMSMLNFHMIQVEKAYGCERYSHHHHARTYTHTHTPSHVCMYIYSPLLFVRSVSIASSISQSGCLEVWRFGSAA